MSELKACPFCECESNPEINKNDYGFYVLCTWCGAKTNSFKTKEEAIEQWQSRPIEDTLRAENARIRELVWEMIVDSEFWIFKQEGSYNNVDIEKHNALIQKAQEVIK